MAKKKSAEQREAAKARRSARQTKAVRAKAEAAERRRRQRAKQRLVTAGAVLGLVLVVVAGVLLVRALDNTAETSAPPAGATDEFALGAGEAGAPNRVVIYEDFLCPGCAALEQGMDQQLAAAVEEGRVMVEYRAIDFLGRFGDYSKESANALAVVLDAAGPEVAKEFHDLLFADQPSESGPFPDEDWLVEKAVEAGAEESQVRPGIEELAFEGWVADATDDASRSGITSTPTVLVNGRQVGGDTISEIANQVLGAVR